MKTCLKIAAQKGNIYRALPIENKNYKINLVKNLHAYCFLS